MQDHADSTRASYDRVADEYTRLISDELKDKPFDREVLDGFAASVAGKGRVCDLGCGPGQVARYLHERGADAFGIDLSPAMLEQARLISPAIEFRQGDMRALDLPDEALAGIAAFYSIIHIPRREVTAVLGELHRILQPGGLLLLAFHRGRDVVHMDEWWGQPVSLDFAYFEREEMEGYLRQAGFTVEQSIERAPYPEVEHQSHRVYLLARKPQLAGT
jgi:SAM-dependent methyltransferase